MAGVRLRRTELAFANSFDRQYGPDMHSTTPRRVTNSLRRLLVSLGSVGTPQFLRFSLVSSDCQIGCCLSTSDAEDRISNVEIIFDWPMWELRLQSFIDAEFYAVVRRNGQIQDITPRRDGEMFVLFVPDSHRVAIRQDEHTWSSWTNHKKRGAIYEATRPIDIYDTNSNGWAPLKCSDL
jgi:hypothetical protein